ncbi:MAG: pyridoxamine 5'-phosphate oxidase, partial [Bradyrhizobium sp.]
MTQTATRTSADVMFSPAVKAIQARKGSRESYARVAETRGFRREVDA